MLAAPGAEAFPVLAMSQENIHLRDGILPTPAILDHPSPTSLLVWGGADPDPSPRTVDEATLPRSSKQGHSSRMTHLIGGVPGGQRGALAAVPGNDGGWSSGSVTKCGSWPETIPLACPAVHMEKEP